MKIVALLLALGAFGCSLPVEAPAPAPESAPSPQVAPTMPQAAPALPPTSYSVAVDPGLSSDDLGATMAGILAWEAASPARFDVKVAVCSGEDICVAYGPPSFTIQTPDPTDPSYTTVALHGPAGYCSWFKFGWGGRIQLDLTSAAVGPDRMAVVVEHELGHAMGLVHHEGGNVMNATLQSVQISADDVAQWLEVHAHGPQAADPQA